jgi:beta-lactamase regulating signal transducer with metallopeptidase domain
MSPLVTLAVGIALKGALVLAVALLLSRGLRHQSAALRHTVWTAAFASLLLIPVLALALPPLRVVPVRAPAAVAPEWARGIGSGEAPTPAIAPIAPTAATAPSAAPVLAAPRAAAAPNAVAGPAAAGGRWPRAATPASAARGVGGRAGSASASRAPTAPVEPATARGPAGQPVIGEAAPTDRSIARLAGWIWAIGAGLSLGWVLLGELAVRWLASGARPVQASAWRALLEEMELTGELPRSTRVLEVDRPIVPFTFGMLTPVVLLPAAGHGWSPEQRRHVLTHELAHVRRRDCLTHFLGRVACALHWFNPLAWWALHEARREREHACDDVVLASGSRASGYAETLLATARAFQAPPGLASAGLALARRSQLSERLLAVLDPGRRRTGLRSPVSGGVLALSAAITLPLAALAPATATLPRAATTFETPVPRAVLPPSTPAAVGSAGARELAAGVSAPPTAPAAEVAAAVTQGPRVCPMVNDGRARTVKVTSSMSITGQGSASDGDNSFVVWTGRDCSVVIHLTGKPTFTAAEDDIASLPNGSRFTITDSEGDVDRVYDVRAQGGSLERAYTVDGRDGPMDPAFERWRAALVLEYIRRSGYDAKGRTLRILAQRGVDGVLQEIGQIGSDWAAGMYFRALLESGKVSTADAARVLEAAGRRLASDYELGRVLATVPPDLIETEAPRRAFVGAVRTMDSDYEKRKALSAILQHGSISPTLTGQLLEIAQSIGSDYELSSLLIGLADRGAVTGEFDRSYLAAVRTIESDYEKHRVLSALLKSGPRSMATLEAALEASTTIESDYELGTWLGQVAEAAHGVPDAMRPAYFRAVGSIESSHERSKALLAALTTPKPSAALVGDVIEAASGIDSDYELARVLGTLAERGLVTDPVKPAFRRVLDQVGSTYERQRVLAALGERATDH